MRHAVDAMGDLPYLERGERGDLGCVAEGTSAESRPRNRDRGDLAGRDRQCRNRADPRATPLHSHQDHDLTAIILKGYGTLTIGDRKLELRPGSIVTIPRGTPHSFLNKSPEPAVAYAMFNPAFDNADFVPVQQESLVKTQKK